MAKVWFVRRRGAQWVAAGRTPVHEAALADLVFKLDLHPNRWLAAERPVAASATGQGGPDVGTRVIVETSPEDLRGPFTTYKVGFYDSPYPPPEAAHRLGVAPR